ncbi:hypothetical protein [Streptomyces sp. NPDC057302]|uniref:hypothetical protein n=1 Tax=Streptomyces sp. NPDC057302 TaxID=3346094 RepID=UPI0036266909
MTDWHPGERPPDDGAGLPLPALPATPAMSGYQALRETLRKLSFRHAADALRAPAPAQSPAQSTQALFGNLPKAAADDGFRVLDGLWFPARGGLWQRVDRAYVQDCRARWLASDHPRALDAAAVVAVLESVLLEDPMGLRRLVLWELCCRLSDGAADQAPPSAAHAVALGVHRAEAGLLVDAVAAVRFPAAGTARHAAETLADIWPGPRLREAERLARLIPPAPADHVLAAVLGTLHARSESVHHLTDTAAQLADRGDLRGAAAAWLGALRQAHDDVDAQAGLLRVAALLADDPFASADAQVTAAVDDRTVRLSWHAPSRGQDTVSYRVLRYPDGAPEHAVEVSSAGSARTAVDPDPPTGRPLRYAVFPLRRGHIAGVPRVTTQVLLTPDVSELRVEAVPDGVRVRWRPDPSALEVAVVRTADGESGPGQQVFCEHDQLLDAPLPVGLYVYEVRCGYPGPTGRLVWSPGRTVTARADRWPSPVDELSVRRLDDGRVRIAWRPPSRGEGHLVPWFAHPVPPGADVSEHVGRLAPPDGVAPTSADVLPPPRERLRMTAVSVLGDRAVSGPNVVVERQGEVRDLEVRRVAADRAELQFDWPEPAVLALISWEDGVRGGERRVARSQHVSGRAVELQVSPAECRFTVTALPRPDAVAIAAPSAQALLPAAPPPVPALPPVADPWWRAWWRRWRAKQPPAPSSPAPAPPSNPAPPPAF